MFLELLRAFDHPGDIISDDLRDGGFARRVFGDRTQDRLVEPVAGGHAEVFGEIQIRPAVAGDEFPEFPVRDVLHGREREERAARWKIFDHARIYVAAALPARVPVDKHPCMR